MFGNYFAAAFFAATFFGSGPDYTPPEPGTGFPYGAVVRRRRRGWL